MSFMAVMYHHQNKLWQEDHKVSFHGEEKLVYVHEGVTTLDVQVDLYSDAKEWANNGSTNPNGHDWAKYNFPIRTIGGDPTVSGGFAGDLYFMQNGWRIVVDLSKVTVTGILYSDDFTSPWLHAPTLEAINPAVVSNLALKPGIGDVGAAVWEAVTSTPVSGTYGEAVQNIESNASTAALGGNGLTAAQTIQLAEIFTLMGLDPTKPLVAKSTSRAAGASIVQTITGDAETSVTVTRTT